MSGDRNHDAAAVAERPPLGPALDDLDTHLRHADPDRWLAARLIADPAARGEVLALYALNDELASVAGRVRDPMMGEIRLAWWREALDAAAEGRGGEHPVARAIALALSSGRLARAPLDRILDARRRDLDAAPFADEPSLVDYLDDTAGALMQAAASLLDPRTPPGSVLHAGRAWGWSELGRHLERWTAAGRRWAPADWTSNGDEPPADAWRMRARARVAASLKRLEPEIAQLPVTSFPAVAYVRLVRPRLKGREPGDAGRRARLVWGSLLGRI